MLYMKDIILTSKLSNMFQQFLRFASVGLCGTSVQYVILWIGVNYFEINAANSSGVGYILGAILNYILNYFLTFNSKSSHKETIIKYILILIVGWSINYGLMMMFTNYFSWNIWFSQCFATGIGLMWNFFGSKLWVFKN